MFLNVPFVISWDELIELGREKDLEQENGLRIVEEIIEEKEAFAALNEFVDSLPLADRRMVKAVYYDGRSQADVARELGVSPATITKRFKKIFGLARRALWAFRFSVN